MKNRLLILLAIVTLVASSLACSVLSSEPTASNFYMANDESGKNKTTVFASTDALFVFFEVRGIDAGAHFQARWYVLDYEDQDPNSPFQTSDYDYEEAATTIYFQLTNDRDWPISDYRVEIYMDDVKVGEQQFSVQ